MKKILLVLFCLVGVRASAAVSVVCNNSIGNPNSAVGTATLVMSVANSDSCSGATHFIVGVVDNLTDSCTEAVSDSINSSYSNKTTLGGVAGGGNACIWFFENASSAATMTFTVAGGSGSNNSIFVIGTTGLASSSTLDKQSSACFGSASPCSGAAWPGTGQPGSITPTVTGEFVVVLEQADTGSGMTAITNSFTIGPGVSHTGQHQGLGFAYLVDSATSAINPTVTDAGISSVATLAIASFKPGAGAVVTNPPHANIF